jgi:hypothetical protein
VSVLVSPEQASLSVEHASASALPEQASLSAAPGSGSVAQGSM